MQVEHSKILRPVVSFALAAVVALALAWFMYFLTHSSKMGLSDVTRVHMLDFVRLKRDESAQRKDRKPERPQQNEVPEAPPMESQASDAGSALTVSVPSLSTDINIGRGGIGLGGDGEYLPIVKVAPVYPRRALDRGITGTCMVSYNLTTSGTVKDVSVVEGQCDHPVFERPSIEAALRFKYKPRVIDGEAIEVLGVYNLFHYTQIEPGEAR